MRTAVAPAGRLIASDRDRMDLADPDSIRAAVRDSKLDVMVNAAGHTIVDRVRGRGSFATPGPISPLSRA